MFSAIKQPFSHEKFEKVQEFSLESPKPTKKNQDFNVTPERKTKEVFETPKKKKSFCFKGDIELLETPKQDKDFVFFSTFKSPRPQQRFSQNSINQCLSGGQSTIEAFSRFEEDYEVLKVLGSGNFGCVYQCKKHIDGNVYAVKVIKQKMRGGMAKNALNEVISLSAFTNSVEDKNIVRYYSAWIEKKQLYIVMEYCSQSLRQYQKANPIIRESVLRKIARDIGIALKHLHDNNLVHLDIKPGFSFLIQKTSSFLLMETTNWETSD